MLADKIYRDVRLLIIKLAQVKERGKKIVMTNGCFDILHAGHVLYLEEAKLLGDFLVVAVNSDFSIANLKGKSRPVIEQSDRLCMVAALESVDAVILFDEDTPENLIKNIIPDVLVKGADYTIEAIAGYDFVVNNGGVVKTITFKNNISTSKIIDKIWSLNVK